MITEHTQQTRKSRSGLKKWWLTTIFMAALVGCEARRAPEPLFPGDAVVAALGLPSEAAQKRLAAHFPGSAAIPGGLWRLRIEDSQHLDGAILFSNVRTGRVDTVILKYRPDLSSDARREVLATLDAGLTRALESGERASGVWRGFGVEVLGADRDGRLTVTVSILPPPR